MRPTVPIQRLYPRPRPVALAGRTFLVGEMRLADLADLSGWLERRWECPLEALRPTLDGLDERGRTDALRGIWDAVEAGPPAWGTPEGMRRLSTEAGMGEIIRVVLRWHNPELFAADGTPTETLKAVAEAMTPEEYDRMLTAWRRHEPIDELAHLLGMDGGGGGTPIGWAQAACELCEAYGWTLDHVMTLTLGQVRTARGGGKPVERGIAVAPRTGGLRERVRELRARIFGDGEKGGSDGG